MVLKKAFLDSSFSDGMSMIYNRFGIFLLVVQMSTLLDTMQTPVALEAIKKLIMYIYIYIYICME